MRTTLVATLLACVLLGTSLVGTAAAPEETGGAHGFKLLIDGSEIASFTRLDGLDAQVDIIEFRSGEDGSVRKIPGRTTYSEIVLTRAYRAGASAPDDPLWLWFREAAHGRRDLRDGRIEILDPSGRPVGAWCFREAWIARWVGPVLPADRNQAPTEVIELAHEGFSRCGDGPAVAPAP